MYSIAFLAHYALMLFGCWILLAPKWHGSERQRTVAASITGLLCFGVGYAASFPSVSFWDFVECYYPAGQAALTGDDTTLRELYVRVVQGFVNIPIVAYLFAPFALFDQRIASIIYAALGVAAIFGTWRFATKVCALNQRASDLLLFLLVTNGAFINGIKFGNTSHFILFLLVTGLWSLRNNQNLRAGIILGMATVLKPALGLFGFFFILRRDYRGLAGYALSGLSVILMSLLVFGWEMNRFWFETAILQFGHQWFGTFSVQSVAGFLLRLRTDYTMLTTWQPFQPTAAETIVFRTFALASYTATLLTCLAASRSTQRGPGNRLLDLQFLVVVCLAIITSPLSWSHYFVWLLLPAAYLVADTNDDLFSTRSQRVTGWVALALTMPLVMWPFSLSHPLLTVAYQKLFVSHQLIAAILWFGLILSAMLSRGRKILALDAQQKANI